MCLHHTGSCGAPCQLPAHMSAFFWPPTLGVLAGADLARVGGPQAAVRRRRCQLHPAPATAQPPSSPVSSCQLPDARLGCPDAPSLARVPVTARICAPLSAHLPLLVTALWASAGGQATLAPKPAAASEPALPPLQLSPAEPNGRDSAELPRTQEHLSNGGDAGTLEMRALPLQPPCVLLCCCACRAAPAA